MLQFVNGYREPAFRLVKISDSTEETVQLVLCDTDGMEEYNEFKVIWYDIINGKRIPKWRGIRKHFILSYSAWSDVINSMKIQTIVNRALDNANYRIYIIPRYDYAFRNYKSNYSGEPISVGIHGGGLDAIGNTKIILKFETEELVSALDWINPNDILYPTTIHPHVISLET